MSGKESFFAKPFRPLGTSLEMEICLESTGERGTQLGRCPYVTDLATNLWEATTSDRGPVSWKQAKLLLSLQDLWGFEPYLN